LRFYLIIVELPQKYNFFRRNCHKNTTFLEEIPSTLLFLSMVFKEFGGVGVFPFSEYVALG